MSLRVLCDAVRYRCDSLRSWQVSVGVDGGIASCVMAIYSSSCITSVGNIG